MVLTKGKLLDGIELLYEGNNASVQQGKAIDKLIDIAHNIQYKVDDLACNIYPPQDKYVVWKTSQELVILIKDLLGFSASGELITEAETFVKLSGVLEKLTNTATDQLSTLCQPQE